MLLPLTNVDEHLATSVQDMFKIPEIQQNKKNDLKLATASSQNAVKMVVNSSSSGHMCSKAAKRQWQNQCVHPGWTLSQLASASITAMKVEFCDD